jgi:hypothetical protein
MILTNVEITSASSYSAQCVLMTSGHPRSKRTATSVFDNLGSFNLLGTTVIIIWYPQKECFAGSGFLGEIKLDVF